MRGLHGTYGKGLVLLGTTLGVVAAVLAARRADPRLPALGVESIKEPGFEKPGAGEIAWADSIAQEASPARLRADVEAMPAPRNRLHSPRAMLHAEGMIRDRFCRAGLTVERQPFRFTDVSGYTDYEPFESTNYPLLEGANIVATKFGEESAGAVVVVAHYDTVRDSPGANDNTASVAALMELARLLVGYRFRYTVILAAVDMEELGFLGSKSLVSRLTGERRVLAAINFETLAYTSTEPGSQTVPPGLGLLYREQVRRIRGRQSRGDFTVVIHDGAAAALALHFVSGLSRLAGRGSSILLRDPNDFPVVGKLLNKTVPLVREFSRSDHVPFWEAGIPAIQITDTANFRYPHYHKPTDTHEKLDYERLSEIVAASAGALAREAGLILAKDGT